jgi:hypothetical protein
MRADLPKLVTTGALIVIALCAIISTVAVLQIRSQLAHLYNITAKPHCYLSPNDPRRREVEKQWGTEPTSEGTCDDDEGARR